MTPSEFINTESSSFNNGEIVIVAGPDLEATYILLLAARDKIRGDGGTCLDPLDTDSIVYYGSGSVASDAGKTASKFKAKALKPQLLKAGNTITFITGANAGITRTISEVNKFTEYVTFSSAFPSVPSVGDIYLIPLDGRVPLTEWLIKGNSSSIILLADYFDRENTRQNIWNVNVSCDVTLNMRNIYNHRLQLLESGWKLDCGVREMFLWWSKVYWYEDGAITKLFDR